MPETQDYAYAGHVMLNVNSSKDYSLITDPDPSLLASLGVGHTAKAVESISVSSVEHLIPISVTCNLDGKETVLTAYIDYTSNNIHLPTETSLELKGADSLFSESVVAFLMAKGEEATRKHDEMYHPIRPQHMTVAATPTDEDSD